MQKKALLALLLAMTMLLSGCSLIQKDPAVDAATEIIRVGDIAYTKAEVLSNIDYELQYMAYMYSMYGMNFDPTDPAVIADSTEYVLDSMVEMAVRSLKSTELGLDQLTEEEQAQVTAAADATWQENRDYAAMLYIAEDADMTEEEREAAIDEACASMGVSYDAIMESEKAAFVEEKLYQHVIKDVAVTEEELQAEYDAAVEAEKTDYEATLSNYGYAVNNGTTVYYRPAGYRMVKQILIKFSEEDQTAINEAQTELNAINTTVTTQISALNSLGVTDTVALTDQVTVTLDETTGEVLESVTAFAEDLAEDVKASAQTLAEAKARSTFYSEKVAALTEAAFASIAPAADDVLAQLEAGADWDALMAEKNEDPGMQAGAATAETGYAVCENYTYFDSAFTTAAMSIPEVGQWSDKTEGSYGYYIIQYTSEVAEGPVALDEVREELSATVLSNKQNTTFTEQVTAWIEAANVKIDREALED